LGQFEESGSEGNFTFAAESPGEMINPKMRRDHDLDISGIITHCQLQFSIIFSPGRHRQETVETLLSYFKEEMLEIIEHCRHKKESEKTPGDFTYSDISIEEYESILKKFQQ
jgi:non-ribosomal peptide synthase protein (TIGR01720 family)